MKIKRFNEFVNETIKTQSDDDPTQASAKNFWNAQEITIQKFLDYKNKLMDIYKNATNKLDLINKLFNNKFIKKKTDDSSKMIFVSPDPVARKIGDTPDPFILKMAQIADKKRKAQDLEKIVKGNNKDIENYKQEIADNKDSEAVIQATTPKIDKAKERLQKNEDDIKELSRETARLDNDIKKELDKLKIKHNKTKKDIEAEDKATQSNPAEIADESSDEETQKAIEAQKK
jgi:septal ring factor EnvC (AmiA/AmiB activator)